MKPAFCLLLLFLCAAACAQKLEKYFDYLWKPCAPENARYYTAIQKKDSLWTRVDYYIREKYSQMTGSYLDEENKIPHGKFAYYHPNKQLEGTGEYRNGKREGLWLWFHENGMMSDSSHFKNGRLVGTTLRWYFDGMIQDSLVMNEDGSGVQVSWFQNGHPSSAGWYSAGEKLNGKWKFYHNNGQLSAVEVYDKGKLLNREYFDKNGQAESDTTNKDREAKPESAEKWKKYLESTAYFPSQWKITGANQAVVIVRFAVDEEGKVVEPMVTYSFHPDFDKIVYDAIKKSPRWQLAISHNRAIKTYHTQPITFSQQEQ
ncbi:energy transducer TonB [Flavisolibacter ginsenosidimutans]|uniref:TonB C-terminal domain-containing protein n=1 Tax=Flavisolibacter ginsenosidimutans TaxID=661481 RepID=A0A5B8UIK3_9BACT|nr:energy transducer TonB [Flavisolibacter ginsenosidimutans]QEC56511.1 hypothetical protein FSB75_11600 [Flavisolibacter ginsenosidimutans]